MIQALSVLIPTYHCRCKELVCSLHQQLMEQPVTFEIIVVDDGSHDTACIQENQVITALPHCTYHIEEQNRGRAGVRNYLAHLAQYDYLLFIDGDMSDGRRCHTSQFTLSLRASERNTEECFRTQQTTVHGLPYVEFQGEKKYYAFLTA